MPDAKVCVLCGAQFDTKNDKPDNDPGGECDVANSDGTVSHVQACTACCAKHTGLPHFVERAARLAEVKKQ